MHLVLLRQSHASKQFLGRNRLLSTIWNPIKKQRQSELALTFVDVLNNLTNREQQRPQTPQKQRIITLCIRPGGESSSYFCQLSEKQSENRDLW